MKSNDIYVLALIFVIYATSGKFLSQKSSGSAKSKNVASKGGFDAAVMCSEAGNCSCRFAMLYVTVKCTNAGDKLDEIVSRLPTTTTHL